MATGHRPARLLGALRSRRRRPELMIHALQRKHLRSEQARREAEAAHNAKVRFFASVNHDLRQPLNALGLLAQTLQASAPNPRTREVADHMAACVEGMGQVVDELLGLSRLDATTLAAQPAAWRLSDVLHEVAHTFEPLARAKGLRLNVQIDAPTDAPTNAQMDAPMDVLVDAPMDALVDAPCRVCCDRALLSRVLGNLVSNAIRYTAQGSVRLVALAAGQSIELSVEDTGVGIAAQHLPHIFDEFYRVAPQGSEPAHDHPTGMGLGLATVKRLTTLMGLQVRVQSVVGQGSRFAITLPRADDHALPAHAPAPARTAPAEAPLRCRVLVVDDDADSRTALHALLTTWGCDVQATAAVAQADPTLARGWRPDVIVADMHLDNAACGLAAVRQVRARLQGSPGEPPLPALLVTGDVGSPRMREAQALGYTVLTKPIKAARLRAFLNQALAGRVERRLAVRVVAG